MLERCLHVNICVRNLDRSLRFYEQLGFTTRIGPLDVEDPRYGESIGMHVKKARVAFIGLKDDPYSPMLDLAEFIDPPTQGSAYPNLINVGICRLAFAVADIDAIVRKLKEIDAEFVTGITDMQMQGKLVQRVVMFQDPDGIVLEAVQLMDSFFNAPWARPEAGG